MKLKKYPRTFALSLLTIGASLTLGLLSFGGMFALWPVLPFAFAALGLSVAYEGEIYWQNLKSAWSKLFKRNHLKHQLANDYLLENFPESTPLLENFCNKNPGENCPPIFNDYKTQLELLHKLNETAPSDKNSDQIKQVEKTIHNLEVWFDRQIFADTTVEATELAEKEVRSWLKDHPPAWPQFFTDYQKQLNLLEVFGHASLEKKSAAQKKQVEKTLRDMEKWFAVQLSTNPGLDAEKQTPYTKELRTWLATHQQNEWQALFIKRRLQFLGVKVFSALAGLFMSLGTTYLLVEAFSVIPWFMAISLTTWPVMILPMAAFAGTAYGLLTFNAVTDMINNNTVLSWTHKIRSEFKNGITLYNLFITSTAVLLLTLAVALTICTAGTWWTIAKQTPPLFTWMGKIPGFIMGIINPIITGFSAVMFNLQNTSESLQLIDDTVRQKGNIFTRTFKAIKHSFQMLQKHENLWQIVNPFRLLLKITITPLRVLLFIGHLVSIGVTADRMPGISQLFSALLGIISEGFEDYHYFFGQAHEHEEKHEDEHHHEHKDEHQHDHEHAHAHSKKDRLKERLEQGHGHNHDLDFPTKALKIIFSPIYFLAASWDCIASTNNSGERRDLTFGQALGKQWGDKPEKTRLLPENAPRPSADWRMEHVVYRIEDYKEKHLHQVSIGNDIAKEKIVALTLLQKDLRDLAPADNAAIETLLTKPTAVYNKQRFFGSGKTETATFIEELPQRINLSVG